MQAANIGKLEGELTAKDRILTQALESAKVVEDENAQLKADLSMLLEAAKIAQAEKERAAKEARESAQQALKVKEVEIHRLLWKETRLKESNVNYKAKFRNLDMSHRRKSFPSILLITDLIYWSVLLAYPASSLQSSR